MLTPAAPVGLVGMGNTAYLWTKGGAAYSWGDNEYGQAGQDSDDAVIGVATTLAQSDLDSIASGTNFACLIKDDAGVRRIMCAGLNDVGQLGIGSLVNSKVFAELQPSYQCIWSDIWLGATAGYGLQDAGDPINPESPASPSSPVEASPASPVEASPDSPVEASPASPVEASPSSPEEASSPDSPVIHQPGIYGWGSNTSGALAIASGIDTDFPSPTHVGNKIAGIKGGRAFACAMSPDLVCWGSNESGQLGINSTENYVPTLSPVDVGPGMNMHDVGGAHACVIRSIGATCLCWGANAQGQVGIGSNVDANLPQIVTGSDITYNFIFVTTGDVHTCAITVAEAMYCWGDNTFGQLGTNNAPVASNVAAAVDNSLHSGITYSLAVATNKNTCAFGSDNGIYCWGAATTGINANSDLDTNVALVPASSIGAFAGTQELAGLGDTVYLLQSNGSLLTWGANDHGQTGLGSGQADVIQTPSSVFNAEIVVIASGSTSACALRYADDISTLYCWGNNANGQLGLGSTQSFDTPQTLPDICVDCSWSTVYAGFDFGF
ncbi:hypothetical protein H632_c2206p0, partial [Helicosporidium sp. ATCC 50920]